jgi:predicted TIM-barrel fold metal-dependent hydrolase
MIVDAQVHVWRATAGFPDPAATIVSPLCDVPIELAREYMAEYEVDRAVLVQPLYPGEDNSYVADCAAANPERFAAVCVVDPLKEGAADRLEYWVLGRGCRGLRLRPRLPSESAMFGHPDTYPLWERARSLKVIVSVLASPEHLQAIAALAERFPEVPIVIDHMGYPDVTGGVGAPGFKALLDLSHFQRLFVKVSGYYYYSREGYPYADCLDFFNTLYDVFGPTRLIWGSDFPHVLLKTGYRRSLQLQQRVHPFLVGSRDLDLIMGENAVGLYWE